MVKQEPQNGCPQMESVDDSIKVINIAPIFNDQTKICKIEDIRSIKQDSYYNWCELSANSYHPAMKSENNLNVCDGNQDSTLFNKDVSVKTESFQTDDTSNYHMEVFGAIDCKDYVSSNVTTGICFGGVYQADDIWSPLMEVFGAINCKNDISGNVTTGMCVGKVYQTDEEHCDEAQQEPLSDLKYTNEIKTGDSRLSRSLIPRDIDDSTDPDIDDEKPFYRGTDEQPANYSNGNKRISTQDAVIRNVQENTANAKGDNNSVLCDKELCEGVIKSFPCTRCEMHFTSMEELTSHYETHKLAAPYKCHVCDKGFVDRCNLTRHLRIHSGERPFKCDVCDKCFSQKGNLIGHLRIHSGERPFKCHVCDNRFKLRGALKGHLAIHSGERQFKCNVCDRRFTQSGALTVHLRIHGGERPFKCNVCDKRFTQSSALTVHLRIHGGERSFKCNVCDKCFTHKGNLTRHLGMHKWEQWAQVNI